jgi:hypothetical protein
MRKVTLLILTLLTVAGAIGTSAPAVAVGGGGTPGCKWTCNCAGTPVCICTSTSGLCSYPSIQCPQIYTC